MSKGAPNLETQSTADSSEPGEEGISLSDQKEDINRRPRGQEEK